MLIIQQVIGFIVIGLIIKPGLRLEPELILRLKLEPGPGPELIIKLKPEVVLMHLLVPIIEQVPKDQLVMLKLLLMLQLGQ